MKKFPIIVGIITVLIIVIGVILFSKGNSSAPLPLPANYELFFSTNCLHCKNVEEFLKTWSKKGKIKIDQLEISSRENSNKAIERATSCKIKSDEIGVPFMFTPDGKCYMGDEPIINFLKSL